MWDSEHMNILFVSLVNISSIRDHSLYPDLLRQFVKHGHRVVVMSPVERLAPQECRVIKEPHVRIVRFETGRIQKTSVIEKGINTVLIEPRLTAAIRKYCSRIHFNLVLYPTPPITVAGAVAYVRKRDHAKTYLLLKDIFPQNAVDIGMLQTDGPKGILYRYFRGKEKQLYRISDYIGCMSEANVKYLLRHNPELNPNTIEACPNAVEPVDMSVDAETRNELRKKYDIPTDKRVFIYGGNLGKPQDIPFIIECLKKAEADERLTNVFFLIVGSGTEAHLLDEYVKREHPTRVKVLPGLPKEDYDRLAGSCDVGLIFLDHRFTIPNFPSRLLSYMQAHLPVFAVTDKNTDIGKVIESVGIGWWCESRDADAVVRKLEQIHEATDLESKGNRAWEYLLERYDVGDAYRIIMRHLAEVKE